MNEYISREDVLDIASQYCTDDDGSCSKADVDLREMLDEIEALPAADVQPVKKTEFQIGYEQGFKDGRASAALPNTIDNGDKIDGYTYVYKTDSRGEPYIHIDSVRNMLKKAADVQPVDRWISVKDGLPDNGVEVIVNEVDMGIIIGWYDTNAEEFRCDVISPIEVTHWMPLPEPPNKT